VTPCPILGIRVADGRPGEPASPFSLHFDHAEVGEEGSARVRSGP
jgi:2-octaprenyl-6-methoxyphenol hydroxylase